MVEIGEPTELYKILNLKIINIKIFQLFQLKQWQDVNLSGNRQWRIDKEEMVFKKSYSDSGGIRTHAISDWCLKPAP